MRLHPIALARGFFLAIFALTLFLGTGFADDSEKGTSVTEAQKDKLKAGRSQKLAKQARKLRDEGKFADALKSAKKLLALELDVLGPDHMRVANTYQLVASLQEDTNDFPGARKSLEEAIRIKGKLHGEEVLESLQSALEHINVLERLKPDQRARLREADRIDPGFHSGQKLRRHNEAIPGALRALAIRKEVLGEKDPEYVNNLIRLGLVFRSRGEYAKAAFYFRQALAIRKETVGTQHHDYALSLNNLGQVLLRQGEFAQAETMHREALAIDKAVSGEKSLDYLNTLRAVTVVYLEKGDFPKAKTLLLQAKEIRKELNGGTEPSGSKEMHLLATLYRRTGELDKAEQLFKQMVAYRKARSGGKSALYASSIRELANIYTAQGKFDLAEPLFLEALPIYKQRLGDKTPQYAQALHDLAQMYERKNDFAKAEPLYRQACTIILQHLEHSAEDQTEMTQLAYANALRVYLDGYLHNSAQAKTPPAADAYALVLAWKGATTARQRLERLARIAENADPETAQSFEELAAISRELGRLARGEREDRKSTGSSGEDVSKRIQELSAQREKLEIELSKRTAEFRRYHEGRTLTPAGLQALLPAGTVLVDFLSYGSGKFTRMVAFVITKDHIERVELGLSLKLPGAVESFRASVARRTQAVTDKDDPALVLRNKIWQPLEKHLTGAKLVLISPDGPLTQLPFAALPGKEEGKFLLEEISLAVLPVPRMLPELLTKRSPERSKSLPSLLALGDPDFDGNPADKSALDSDEPWRRSRNGERMKWSRLPGTRGELLAIEDTFRRAVPQGKLTTLREGQATEGAVRKLAPQHEYLHLATHGFFAPREVRSAAQRTAGNDLPQGDQEQALIGYHPGLLSGLALAGANKPAGDDDGVLTALEVAELDLSKVELAVLSACETGLGEVAGGEGVLGLQRAFQVAGARSTVTSFWKVDDQATRNLMERFYDNYWKKGMGAQEALREAQLVMLREGVKRGMVREDDGLKKEARTPPYYWAAFVLSGDWR